jgi:hypothetical protein
MVILIFKIFLIFVSSTAMDVVWSMDTFTTVRTTTLDTQMYRRNNDNNNEPTLCQQHENCTHKILSLDTYCCFKKNLLNTENDYPQSMATILERSDESTVNGNSTGYCCNWFQFATIKIQ